MVVWEGAGFLLGVAWYAVIAWFYFASEQNPEGSEFLIVLVLFPWV